jgi:hypothetical protein
MFGSQQYAKLWDLVVPPVSTAPTAPTACFFGTAVTLAVVPAAMMLRRLVKWRGNEYM